MCVCVYHNTGASPISDEVMTFLRVCFGGTVLEGYGMTESSSAMSTTRQDDLTTGKIAHTQRRTHSVTQA